MQRITALIVFSIDPANQTIDSYALTNIWESTHIYIQRTDSASVPFRFLSKSHLHMPQSRSAEYTDDGVQKFHFRMRSILMENNTFSNPLTRNSGSYTAIPSVLFRLCPTHSDRPYNASHLFSNRAESL